MEAGMPKIACVVVTYNRKKLLMECLGAVLGQSMPVHTLVAAFQSTSAKSPQSTAWRRRSDSSMPSR